MGCAVLYAMRWWCGSLPERWPSLVRLLTGLSPLLRTWFLTRVTSKPLLERRLVTTRLGDAE